MRKSFDWLFGIIKRDLNRGVRDGGLFVNGKFGLHLPYYRLQGLFASSRWIQRHVMADCYSRTMSVVLAPGSKMTRMACWAHLRREVYEHHKRDPQVIALPLALMNQLYDIERRAMMSDLEFAPHSNFKCFTTLGLHLYRGLSLRKLTSSSWIAICYATCCIAATEPFVPDI
jgi:hypothetical protein